MTASSRESAAAEAARRVQSPWSQDRLEQNLARIRARRGQVNGRLKLAVGAAAILAAAAAISLAVPWRSQPPTALVAPAVVVPPVAAVPSARDSKTAFSDGSVARVSDGGELIVKSATPEHIEAILAAGAADFDVTKRAQREFVVVAGPVRVRVVGTRFRVERVGERTRVSVAEGKVEVQHGDAREYLEAGESRFFPSQELPKAEARLHGGARGRFLELARSGEYKAAYQLMNQNPAVIGAGAEDLMLAADAARLSNHPEDAVRYLRRVTSEHSGDSRAPLASFTLGRVLLSQLSRPSEAAEAFALSRRLRPGGGLSEDALAREAEARAAAGGAARARALASDYLTRYPRGKHVATMQRLASSR